jgi:hypothetical protein
LENQIQTLEGFLRHQAPSIERAQSTWECEIAKQDERRSWVPNSGLEAAFPFDAEPETANAGGSLALVAGKIGRAASFDGSAYFDAGQTAGFDIEDRFTITVWIYSDTMPDGSVVSRMVDEAKGRGYGVHLNQGKVHVNLTSVWESDAIRLETEEVLTPGRWHHLAVTYSGSRMAEGLKVIVDG